MLDFAQSLEKPESTTPGSDGPLSIHQKATAEIESLFPNRRGNKAARERIRELGNREFSLERETLRSFRAKLAHEQKNECLEMLKTLYGGDEAKEIVDGHALAGADGDYFRYPQIFVDYQLNSTRFKQTAIELFIRVLREGGQKAKMEALSLLEHLETTDWWPGKPDWSSIHFKTYQTLSPDRKTLQDANSTDDFTGWPGIPFWSSASDSYFYTRFLDRFDTDNVLEAFRRNGIGEWVNQTFSVPVFQDGEFGYIAPELPSPWLNWFVASLLTLPKESLTKEGY